MTLDTSLNTYKIYFASIISIFRNYHKRKNISETDLAAFDRLLLNDDIISDIENLKEYKFMNSDKKKGPIRQQELHNQFYQSISDKTRAKDYGSDIDEVL